VVGHRDVPAVAHAEARMPIPGTVFAGHIVEALVGSGGMGVVHRARHCGLGRIVALKTILPELLDDPSIRRRFLDEAVAAASIEHPNVVPVHDAGESGGVAYIVMRYVHGIDLRELVRHLGPLEPARAAAVAVRLADALDTMHRAGYVHRDVKPRNVLIARGGHVYLSDFGLARRMTAPAHAGETRRGHWVGTVDFAAPEQMCGGRVDARTDVYALGCLLYFALSGRRPFEREDDDATMWAQLYDAPPSVRRVRPGLPRGVDAAIARALAKEPGDRFQSAGELGRAVARAAVGRSEARSRCAVRPAVPSDTRSDGHAPLVEAATVSRDL
jgi:serine/threonine protein kinase